MSNRDALARELPLGTLAAYAQAWKRSKEAGESDTHAHIAGLGAAIDLAQSRLLTALWPRPAE